MVLRNARAFLFVTSVGALSAAIGKKPTSIHVRQSVAMGGTPTFGGRAKNAVIDAVDGAHSTASMCQGWFA
jgi:hypothetical protein